MTTLQMDYILSFLVRGMPVSAWVTHPLWIDGVTQMEEAG